MAKQLVINSIQDSFEDSAIKLLVSSSIEPMMNDKIHNDVTQALSEFYEKTIKLSLEFKQNIEHETPAEFQQRLEDEAKAQFIYDLNNSDFAKAMKENFNAVLLEHSVKRIEKDVNE